MGEVITRLAYGDHVFKEYGAELVKSNVEGIELVAWAYSKLWMVDLFPSCEPLSVRIRVF